MQVLWICRRFFEAPYGPVTGTTCLLVLTLLTAALFLLIRPLLNRKLA